MSGNSLLRILASRGEVDWSKVGGYVTFDELRSLLVDLLEDYRTERRVCEALGLAEKDAGMLHKIVYDRHEPKRPATRERWGLPPLKSYDPTRQRVIKKWREKKWDLTTIHGCPDELIRWMLENREELK